MKLHTLLLEYSDKLINLLINKFKQENENLSDESIKYYIDEFSKRKDNSLIKEKDITKYTFVELEKLIDSLPSKNKNIGKNNNVEFSDSELIYNQQPLQIFHADTPNACIKIKGDFPASWCIARKSGNLYYNYRFQKDEPSFYFVKNIERLNKIKKLEDDPFCFFVIQLYKQGGYVVTSALNDGDDYYDWEDLIKQEPLLKGKEELFTHKPLNDNEKENYKRFKNGINDDEYEKLTFEEKKYYISIKNNLNLNKFINTPNELLNDYINLGVDLSDEQFEFIKNKPKLLSNFRRVSINNVLPEYLNNAINSFGNRWKILTDDEAYDLFKKIPIRILNLLIYKPNLIKHFIDKIEYFSNYEILELLTIQPSLISYFKDRLKNLINGDIAELLSIHPSLISYFEKYLDNLDSEDISHILSTQPKLINYLEKYLINFDTDDITNILSKQPSFINNFTEKITDLSGNDIIQILTKQPTLINYFKKIINNKNLFHRTNLQNLIIKQPSLINYVNNNLSILTNYEIKNILIFQPKLIIYFKDRLNEINGNDVYKIIITQPSLVTYFENRFDELNIDNIIHHQPNLRDYFSKKGLINENLKLYKILLEYSDKLINNLIIKFKQENENLTDENIKYYIKEFEKRKDSDKIKEKDITKYTFEDLEKLIDSFPKKLKIDNNNVEFSNSELIYNKSPLQIFHADSANACIKIKGEFSASWCISRNTGNLYNLYRFSGDEPSFYFVKNIERLNKIKSLNDDPYCFFVIRVTKDNIFYVTSALNDGDKEMSWNEIKEIEPLLNHKINFFRNNPLTNDEREKYDKFKNQIGLDDYINLSYNDKQSYIEIRKDLTDAEFFNTPTKLLNEYISYGADLSDEQVEFIRDKPTLFNNFRRITINSIIPLYIEDEIKYLNNRLLCLTDDECKNAFNLKNDNTDENISIFEFLYYKPSLIEFFKDNIDNLSNRQVVKLLIQQPTLITYFLDRFKDINETVNPFLLLQQQPSLAKYFINHLTNPKLSIYDIFDLVTIQPSLLKYFKNRLNEFNDGHIVRLLTKNPKLYNIFKKRIDKFSQSDLTYLYNFSPNLKNKLRPLLKLNEHLKLLNLIV